MGIASWEIEGYLQWLDELEKQSQIRRTLDEEVENQTKKEGLYENET